MAILNVYMTAVEFLGWESPMETPQQQGWVRCAGHVTAKERPGDCEAARLPCSSAGAELLSAITNSWAPRFSPGPCFLTTVDTKVVLGFRRGLCTWLIKEPGAFLTTTAVPVASQPVHQLYSLCFICKWHFTRAAGHSWQHVWRSYRFSSPVTHLRRAVMA